MIQLKGTQSSLEHTQQLFKDNKRAFYSRFNHADLEMILGRNASDHNITPRLSKEMTEAFQINHPQYHRVLAVGHTSGNISSRKMLELLARKIESTEGVVLENPVSQHFMGVFQPDSIHEVLEELILPKRKMFIGYISKDRAEELIGATAYYIETPAADAYATIDAWWPEVMKHIHDVEMVVLATDNATRVANKRLWETGAQIQSIDIDFLIEILDERESRMWIHDQETEHRMADVYNTDDVSDSLVYPEKESKLLNV